MKSSGGHAEPQSASGLKIMHSPASFLSRQTDDVAQVHQYVLPAEHASLVNTWVEDCSIELPPLLVSVDDHLLALAGRVMRLLKNALIAQPKDAAMALPHALTGTAGTTRAAKSCIWQGAI